MSKKKLLPHSPGLSAKFSTILLAASAIGVAMTACEAAQPVSPSNHGAPRAVTAPGARGAPAVSAEAGIDAAVPPLVDSAVKPVNPCAPTKPNKKKSGNPCG